MLKLLWRAKQILYFIFNDRICLGKCHPLKVKFTFHDSKFQPLDLQLEFCLNATEDTKQNHLLVVEVTTLRDTQLEPGPRGMMRSPSWNTEAGSGASYQPGGDQVHSRHSWIGCGALPSAGEQNWNVTMEILWDQIHSPTAKQRRFAQPKKSRRKPPSKLWRCPSAHHHKNCTHALFLAIIFLEIVKTEKMDPIWTGLKNVLSFMNCLQNSLQPQKLWEVLRKCE